MLLKEPDISCQKKRNLKSKLFTDLLREEIMNIFLSNVSHDIRTPMNAIVGFSNLLRNTDLTFRQKQFYIEEINKNSTELLHLIDNILLTSQIESKFKEIKPMEFSPYNLLSKITHSFNSKQFTNSPQSKLILRVTPLDSKSLIYNDPDIFILIVRSLINCSMQTNPNKIIEIGFTHASMKTCTFFIKTKKPEKNYNEKEGSIKRSSEESQYLFNSLQNSELKISITENLLRALGSTLVIKSSLDEDMHFEFSLSKQRVRY